MCVAEGVLHTLEVRVVLVLPATLELLGPSSAALREPGVADLPFGGQHLSGGGPDGRVYFRTRGARDALVALAMIIGADVEDGVVFAVVPSDEFGVRASEGEEIVAS